MYEEIQTLDLSHTSGVFSLSLGDGSGVRQDLHAWGLFEALSNRQSFNFTAADCNGLTAYTPGPADNRKFRVSFNLGSGWEALPIQTINYIPMSIQTYAVGGFPASSLFRVEDGGAVGNVAALTTTQYDNLVSLADGSSSVYEKSGQLGGSAIPPSLTSGQSFVSDGSGGWVASTPLTSETDPNVQAFAKASLPTCGTGEVLKSDGTTLSCVPDSGGWSAVDATDTVKGIVVVPTSGGLEVSLGAVGLPDQTLTPGSFSKVTVNQKGIVTSGGTLAESDIPPLTTSGKVSGDAITSGEMGGSASINTSGNIVTTGSMATGSLTSDGDISVTGTGGKVSSTYGSFRRLLLLDDQASPHHVEVRAPDLLSADYTLTLPGSLGSANQVLGMNNAGTALENKSITAGSGVSITHSAGGIEISASGSGGTVTSVTGTANEITVGGTSTDPVIGLGDLAVSPAGTFGSATTTPTITVDSKGRVTGVTESTISIPQDAADIANTPNAPVGGISATDVQAAMNELDAEKVSKAGDTMTGALILPSNGLVVGSGQLVVNGGHVGIGTMNPAYPLSVTGDIYSSTGVFRSGANNTYSFTSTGNFKIDASSGGGGELAYRYGGGGGWYHSFYTGSSSTVPVLRARDGGIDAIATTTVQFPLRVFENSNALLVVKGDGNVGIGTTSPQSELDVSGTVRAHEICDETGSNCKDISSGWSGGGGTVTSVTGTTPIQVTTGTSTPVISVDDATESSKGVVTLATDSETTAGKAVQANDSRLSSISGKLEDDLAQYKVFVGDASNKASAGWFGLANLRTPLGGQQFNDSSNCTSSQTLTWSSATDTLTCVDISLTKSQISDFPALGTAAAENVGVSAGNVVQLDSSGKLPALDGSQLTNLPSVDYDTTYFKQDGNSFGEAATLGTNDMQGLNFKTNGALRMMFTSSGALGIGTTSPTANLQLNVAGGVPLRISKNGGNLVDISYDGSDNPLIRAASGKTLGLGANNSGSHLVIDTTGYVGIGTTAPSHLLDINGSWAFRHPATSNLVTSYDALTDGNYKLSQSTTLGSSGGWGGGYSWIVGFGGGDARRGASLSTLSSTGNALFAVGAYTGANLQSLSSAYSNPGFAALTNASSGNRYALVGTLGTNLSKTLDEGNYIALNSLAGASGLIGVTFGTQYRPVASGYSSDFVLRTTNENNTLTEKFRIKGTSGNVGIGTTAPSVSLDVGNKTDAIRLPAGTTAEQPSTSENGMIRYNSDNNKFEAYENGAWTNMIGGNSSSASSVAASAGSAALPSISFGSDTDTGLYSSGADSIGISAGGAKVWDITTSGIVSSTAGGATIKTSAGSASAPTFSFKGDEDTGWYLAAPDTLAATTAGTERVRIDSNGNVGIGTTAPTRTLDLGGAIQFSSANNVATTADMYLSANGMIAAQTGLYLNSGAGGSFGDIFLGSGTETSAATPNMTIKYNGNVGIGTTAPEARLEVAPGSFSGTATPLRSAITAKISPSSSNGYYIFRGIGGTTFAGGTVYGLNLDLTGGTTGKNYGVYVDGESSNYFSGNVGIGTTNPITKLHIAVSTPGGNGLGIEGSSITTASPTIRLYNGATPVLSLGAAMLNNHYIAGTVVGDGVLYTHSVNSLIFGTNMSENMRITPAGNVGIGTTAPSEMLDVNGNIKGTQLCIGADCRSAWPSSGSGTLTLVSKTTDFTVTTGDLGKVFVVNNAANATVTLPSASTAGSGFHVTIKRIGAGNLYINPTLDACGTSLLNGKGSVAVVSTGSAWISLNASSLTCGP